MTDRAKGGCVGWRWSQRCRRTLATGFAWSGHERTWRKLGARGSLCHHHLQTGMENSALKLHLRLNSIQQRNFEKCWNIVQSSFQVALMWNKIKQFLITTEPIRYWAVDMVGCKQPTNCVGVGSDYSMTTLCTLKYFLKSLVYCGLQGR